MDSEHPLPVPETTLVIILGASEFPRAPQFTQSAAFRNSSTEVKTYFIDKEGFNLPPENLLDSFSTAKGYFRRLIRPKWLK